MSREHFCGTWQISKCFLNEKLETVGLEGIKFRLDELGDITWYNDLAHLSAATGREDFNDISESADVLFSCETFEVQMTTMGNGPGLLFAAFAGYSIEFKVDSLKPESSLTLFCDGWYTLLCQRVEPEHHSTAQDQPFTLIGALDDVAFSDGLIESAEGQQFHIHSSILRLNGFDSSSCPMPSSTTIAQSACPTNQHHQSPPSASVDSKRSNQSPDIQISIIPPSTTPTATATLGGRCRTSSSFLLSPKLLISPSLELFHLPSKLASNLSNSFNCLSASIKPPADSDPFTLIRNNISTSDSNLKASLNPSSAASRPNIFTFAGDFVYRQPKGCPPLSPYRSKSPLWSGSVGGSSADTPPLSPLTPAEVLQTLPFGLLRPICHWLYAECLPTGLDEDTLERLIEFTDGMSRLGKMTELCHSYLQMVRLKKLVIYIVSDVHSCLNRCIEMLNPATLSREPHSLWNSCKFCGREVAFACSKVLQFCNIFVKDSHQMSRQQRHEIIKYVRSRLPIFLIQTHQLLQNIMCILANLTDDEKTELVVFLVPEIKASLSLVSDIVAEFKHSLRAMYDDLRSDCPPSAPSAADPPAPPSRSGKHRKTSSASSTAQPQQQQASFRRPTQFDMPLFKHYDRSTKNLKFVLYIYELKKMKDVYGRISAALQIVEEKRMAFDEMSMANKRQTIHQNLEQLIGEIPDFIQKVEYLSSNLEDLNGWKEFKFFFKLATNQINGVITKLLDHRSPLNEAMTHICLLIGKRNFTTTLIDLGLLDSRGVFLGALEADDCCATSAVAHMPNLLTKKLNLTQHCCEPPRHGNSVLSKNALRLLHSGQFSDMEFEIVVPSTVDCNRQTAMNDGTTMQVHVFRAHRVIVATRCEWFSKALSSGMQESIHRTDSTEQTTDANQAARMRALQRRPFYGVTVYRASYGQSPCLSGKTRSESVMPNHVLSFNGLYEKITIHDTSPVIFRRLLLYLYGAPVDKTVGAEQLCELMLLADRFSVDVLKDICESTLKSLIDDDSVLCLLAIADRLNAAVLKANCFSYISQHADVIMADIFQDLTKSLQSEIHDLLHWCGRIPEPWRERKPSKKRSHKSPTASAATTAGTTI